MQFKNLKLVDYVVYGRGAFNQLDEILAPRRKDNFPMIFFLDHYFIGHDRYHLWRIRYHDANRFKIYQCLFLHQSLRICDIRNWHVE